MAHPKGRFSALDAAAEVLRKAGGPLHHQELTRRMIESGLWVSSGKTPAATVQAQIAIEIKTKGERSRFQRVQPAVFGLK